MLKAAGTKAIAFGLYWFVLALLPTFDLSAGRGRNDHRMFFRLWAWHERMLGGGALALHRTACAGTGCGRRAGLVLARPHGEPARMLVWRSEESLWYDVTLRVPQWPGVDELRLSQMGKGDFRRALDYFQRALVYNPYYYVLEITWASPTAAWEYGRGQTALRARYSTAAGRRGGALFLRPLVNGKGRWGAAIEKLRVAIASNPSQLQCQYLLMQIYADQQNAAALRTAAQETLARFHPMGGRNRDGARRRLEPSPESYLNQINDLLPATQIEDRWMRHARPELRPDYAEAWNNIAALRTR